MAAADAALGPLLEPLLQAGRDGRTLVVLTSDHGESLGEHGEATHGIFAYEATLRVPLILYQPRILRPRVVERAGAARGPPADDPGRPRAAVRRRDSPGRSLLEAAAGRPREGATCRPTSRPSRGSSNRGWAPLHGVIHDRTKYVELPIPELYDLAGDPGEARNLAASRPQELDGLRARLAAFREADAGSRPRRENAATLERLRSLGYLGAGDAPRQGALHRGGRPEGARAARRRAAGGGGALRFGAAGRGDRAMPRARPGAARACRLSLVYLGQLERENGNLDGGISALRQALARNPQDTVTATLLGAYLTQAGRPDEALALLEPWATRAEPDLDVLITQRARRGAARPARTRRSQRSSGRARSTRRARAC